MLIWKINKLTSEQKNIKKKVDTFFKNAEELEIYFLENIIGANKEQKHKVKIQTKYKIFDNSIEFKNINTWEYIQFLYSFDTFFYESKNYKDLKYLSD